MTDDFRIMPYGENVLVRMAPPPKPASSLIVRPETADESFASGPEFVFSRKGTCAEVLAIGSLVTEVAPGDLVLVDKLAGEPFAEGNHGGQARELRMVREPAIVAVLETPGG